MTTSWCVGGFDVQVLCDDKPITIKELNGVSYAVIPNGASFFESEEWETDPFGEPFSQNYRYTPFQVKATDTQYGRSTHIALYLDGSKAGTKIITSREKPHVFKGFDTREGVTQFCFSPPRVGNANNKADQKKQPVNVELGSIRFEVSTAVFSRMESNHVSSSSYTDFKDSTKKDAKNAGIDPTKGFMAIKKGKVIEKNKSPGARVMKGKTSLYSHGTPFATGMLRYVTEYAMGMLEGIDREEAVEAAAAAEGEVAEGPHPEPKGGVLRAVADFAMSMLPGGGKGKSESEEGVGGGAVEEVTEDTGWGGGRGESKAKIERVAYGPVVGEIEDL